MFEIFMMFLMVLAFPAILLLIIGFYTALGALLDKFVTEETAPYCDIDPLCHPGFVW